MDSRKRWFQKNWIPTQCLKWSFTFKTNENARLLWNCVVHLDSLHSRCSNIACSVCLRRMRSGCPFSRVTGTMLAYRASFWLVALGLPARWQFCVAATNTCHVWCYRFASMHPFQLEGGSALASRILYILITCHSVAWDMALKAFVKSMSTR